MANNSRKIASRKNSETDDGGLGAFAKSLKPAQREALRAILFPDQEQERQPTKAAPKNGGRANGNRQPSKASRGSRAIKAPTGRKVASQQANGTPEEAAEQAFALLGLTDGEAPEGFAVPDELFPGPHVGKVLYAACGGQVKTLGFNSEMGKMARQVMGDRPTPDQWTKYNEALTELTAQWLETL